MAATPKKPKRPPLERIADALELLLKAQCVKLNMSVADLRSATLVKPEEKEKRPLFLEQSAAELEALAETLPGSAEERDYIEGVLVNAPPGQRMEALRAAHEGLQKARSRR